jgi:hypothetical protein
MSDVKPGIGDGRKSELNRLTAELFARYEKCFGVKLSRAELLVIIKDMFEDNRKNFIKKALGPITYADHDYLADQFRDQNLLEEVKNAEVVESGSKGKGVKRDSSVGIQASSQS